MSEDTHHQPLLGNRIPQACRRTGIGRTKMYELIRDGRIKAVKIDDITIIPETELLKLLEAR